MVLIVASIAKQRTRAVHMECVTMECVYVSNSGPGLRAIVAQPHIMVQPVIFTVTRRPATMVCVMLRAGVCVMHILVRIVCV